MESLIAQYEERVKKDLHHYLKGEHKVDERLPETPDIDGKWEEIAQAYVPFTVEKYEYHRDRPHLKEFMTWHRDVCGCPFEELIIVHYRSPQWTWNALAGREGLLPICRKHKKQFRMMLWSMN